ncbi:MAG TPA: COX15/CtaA family protein [Candidatus Polarisedimenticolia bacterium]
MSSLDPVGVEARKDFDPWRHRCALALSAATMVLLIAGGLVTSTGSGLAVPDWPLSFGGFFPRMVGGVLFEHGHRLIAGTVGLMTLGLTVWFGRSAARPGVRLIAILALGAVFAQSLLGGLTVLLRLPASVSVAHACLAQAFFCLTVLLALSTSPRFALEATPPLAADGAPPLRVLAAAATGLVYTQLILGAIMRHTGAGLAIPDVPLAFGRLVPPLLSFAIAIHYAHRVGAFVTAIAVGWTAARVLRSHRDRSGLRRPALLALALLVAQIALGLTTVATRLAVLPATAHVVTGALLLATCLVLTVRAARLTARRPEAELRSRAPLEEVTA